MRSTRSSDLARTAVIQVVDDNPESLRLLTETLTAEGYDVRPADSGELALAAAPAIRPELILLDIRMPGLDGVEVARRLKASPRTRDIPVIFITASAEIDEQIEGWKTGAVDFISKPFNRRDLLVRVATRLQLSRLNRRLADMVAERTSRLEAANRQLREELEERARVEYALRESEARFRQMANSAPAIVWTSGPDNRIEFCNEYALALTGRQLEELVGQGWMDSVHPDDLRQRYPAYLPLIDGRRPYQVEYRVRRADGEYRWILDNAAPRFLPDGSFAGYIGIGLDITDRKRDQEQLLAAQKFESVGVLVAGVAHRFTNLMNVVMAEADLALSELDAASPAYGSLRTIDTTAIRASEILALLVQYAGRGGREAQAAVDLSEQVEETLRLIRATAPRKLPVTAELQKRLPPIQAEAARIRQVVMNLLTNAFESYPDGQGEVRLSTSVTTVGLDRPRGPYGGNLPPGKYVRLEVSDSGCGIPEEARARIFDPFYSTKALGRGLGLAAVQGIVRGLGGTTVVRSSPGTGSTFEVLFPAAAETTA